VEGAIYSNAGERNDVWRIGGTDHASQDRRDMLKTGQPVRQRAAVHVLTTVVLVAGNTATAPPLNHRAYAEEAENEIGNCGLVLISLLLHQHKHFCEDN